MNEAKKISKIIELYLNEENFSVGNKVRLSQRAISIFKQSGTLPRYINSIGTVKQIGFPNGNQDAIYVNWGYGDVQDDGWFTPFQLELAK
jgi:hypothetical protein